jgi:hypothetical protein
MEYIREIKITLEVDTNKRTMKSERTVEYLDKNVLKEALKEMYEEVEL